LYTFGLGTFPHLQVQDSPDQWMDELNRELVLKVRRSNYILITPARNEQKYIGDTIRSVACQTLLPKRWIICVNDSTDGTPHLVRQEMKRLPFLTLMELHFNSHRSFANKALAVAAAAQSTRETSFDFIGVLDADVTFEDRYYEELLAEFDQRPDLGIAVGTHVERLNTGEWKLLSQPSDIAVCGTQLFRRECFNQIQGYRPLQWGGIDTLAGVMARMGGWQTKTFLKPEYYHHREMGSEGIPLAVARRFRDGIRDQQLGMHPVYAGGKFVNRLGEAPFIVGAAARFAGFCIGYCLQADPNIPKDCRRAFRSEQLHRCNRTTAHVVNK
jgi:glycosyltransferase involved in cell wall biosynthesis